MLDKLFGHDEESTNLKRHELEALLKLQVTSDSASDYIFHTSCTPIQDLKMNNNTFTSQENLTDLYDHKDDNQEHILDSGELSTDEVNKIIYHNYI